jgi:hypothetical protein
MGSELIPGKPGTGGSLHKELRPTGGAAAKPLENSPAPQAARSTPQAVIPAPSKIPWPTMPTTAQKPAATFKCPKCSADARDVARFCPRCHATLRFECPSCRNTQRTGGKCEKCGIDFIKYIGAVVAAKKAEADAIHDRLESRSSLLKGILWLPFNGGVSLIRHFFRRDRD